MTVATIITQTEEIDKLVSEYLPELNSDPDKQISVPCDKLIALCRYANEYRVCLLTKEVDLY